MDASHITIRLPPDPAAPDSDLDERITALASGAADAERGLVSRIFSKSGGEGDPPDLDDLVAAARGRIDAVEWYTGRVTTNIARAWIAGGSPGKPGLTAQMVGRIERDRVAILEGYEAVDSQRRQMQHTLAGHQTDLQQKAARFSERMLALEERADLLEDAIVALRRGALVDGCEHLQGLPPGVRDTMPVVKEAKELLRWSASLLTEIRDQQGDLEIKRARVRTSGVRMSRVTAEHDTELLRKADELTRKDREDHENIERFLRTVGARLLEHIGGFANGAEVRAALDRVREQAESDRARVTRLLKIRAR